MEIFRVVSIYKVTDDLFRNRLTEKDVPPGINYWNECDKFIVKLLALHLGAKKSLFVLAKHLNEEVIENEYEESTVIWLDDFLFFLNGEEEGATIFKNYKIFPNQHGYFHYKSELDKDDNIPKDLKDILINLDKNNDYYEKLMLLHHKMIKSKDLIEDGKKRDINRIASEIESAFLKFDSTQRQTSNFVDAVNCLLDWINEEKGKSDLFPNFYEKQAEYVVATLGNAEARKAVLNIVKSGLATTFNLLFSSVNRERFNKIVENATEFSLFLEQKNQFDEFLKLTTSSIDDEVHADLQVGNIGEDIVYNDLLRLFDNDKEIVRKVNKSEYDFEIWNNTKTAILFYVDAKTTMRGIANSNSIPFFMRKSQWEFLDLDEAKNKYFIARVFKNRILGDVKIKYLKINSETLKP